jgi:hypothetical protein
MPAHLVCEPAEAIDPVVGERFNVRWAIKNVGDMPAWITEAGFYTSVGSHPHTSAERLPSTPAGSDEMPENIVLAPGERYESTFHSGNGKWYTNIRNDWRLYFAGGAYYTDETGASRTVHYVQCLWPHKPWSQHYHAMKLDMNPPQGLRIEPGKFGLKVSDLRVRWD